MEYFLKVSTLLTAPHRNYVLIITLMIWIKYVLKEQLHSGNVPLKHLLSEKKLYRCLDGDLLSKK